MLGGNLHESTDHRSAAFSGSGHRVLSDPHQPGEQAVTPAAQIVTPALVAMTSAGVFACMSGRVYDVQDKSGVFYLLYFTKAGRVR